MPFIGNTPQTQSFAPAIDYFSGNGVTVTFTLSRPVVSVAQLTVAVDNVIQNPSSAFTVSGNSITFTSAPLSGTNNIWVEYTSLITTYAAISQDPSVIGDITATGGFLAEGDFGNSYIDGTIVDYVTGNARITTGPIDDMTFYHGGTSGRSEMMRLSYAGNSYIVGNLGVGTITNPDGLLTLPAAASNTPKIRLQSATSDVDVTITSYADASGTYAAFGANGYLNSSGDEAVFDSAKRSAYVRVDGRSQGAVIFGTATSGVPSERMRINSSGNVGIGTSSPDARLVVFGTTGTNGDAVRNMLVLSSETAAAGAGGGISFGGYSDGTSSLINDFAGIQGFKENSTANNYSGALRFTTRTNGNTPVERMRITSGGLVGIGTSSPWSSISLNTPAAATDGYLGIKDPTYGGDIRFGKGSGINNDAIAGVWSNNNFLFYTDSTERMRITNGGTICMGTTNTDPSGNGVNGLAYVGSASALTANRSGNACFFLGRSTSTGSITIFRYNTADVGNIATNGSNCTYNSTSDYRLKENITPISNALSRVAQLKPVTYTWKKDGSAGEGFIAHELAEVCPEAVTGEKDAVDEEGKPIYQAIDQSVLVATLTAAIQELKAEVDSLKAQLEAK